MVDSPAMFQCLNPFRPLEMQLKPLTAAVIALEDKDSNYFRGIYHREIAVSSDI